MFLLDISVSIYITRVSRVLGLYILRAFKYSNVNHLWEILIFIRHSREILISISYKDRMNVTSITFVVKYVHREYKPLVSSIASSDTFTMRFSLEILTLEVGLKRTRDCRASKAQGLQQTFSWHDSELLLHYINAQNILKIMPVRVCKYSCCAITSVLIGGTIDLIAAIEGRGGEGRWVERDRDYPRSYSLRLYFLPFSISIFFLFFFCFLVLLVSFFFF